MADVTDRWTQVQALFERALDRPPDERTAWLRAAAGSDPDLYAEVADLLDGDDHQHTLLDGRATDLFSDRALDDALAPTHAGERVGPWVLGERIGTGGMGAVYRADRADGFEQTAALKRLKPGMDSDAVLARFRAERQILARLEHPGIARLLDGGVASDGRPYFAMELVEGEPITDAADDRQLGVEARLALFARVCDAVAYAHQNLVVHRDLKPSNVLVTPDGAPKLLDFGIARVLSDDDAHLTQTGHRLLTPAYAAPEQVRGEPPTTATDVYALGGLLYRLLCGAAPLDTGGSRAQAERAVLEGRPERPSTRVTDAAARQRGTTAAALAKRLQGDLDTICLKALRTEPERRYGSAAELGADVRRHLAGQPVAARPATRRYRARLFVRRHRTGVLATAAAVLVAVALTAFYTTRLAAERDRAEGEAAKATEIATFLGDVFQNADPSQAQGDSALVVDVLDRGAARVRAQLAGRPEIQAPLMRIIGEVYTELGRYGEADTLLTDALAMLDGLPAPDPDDVAGTATALAQLRYFTGDFEAADALYRRAVAVREASVGADHPATAATLANLASHQYDAGRYEEADSLFQVVLAVQRRHLPAGDLAFAQTYLGLAQLADVEGDLPRADSLARQALAIRQRHLTAPHTEIAEALLLVGLAKRDRGFLDDAEPYHQAALAMNRELFGDRHAEVAYVLNHLASLEFDREAYVAAERYARDGLAIRRAVLGSSHIEVGASLGNLARIQSSQGDYERARETLVEMLAVVEGSVGSEHPFYGSVLQRIGRADAALGRPASAERLLREGLAVQRAGLPGSAPPLAAATRVLAVFLADREPAEAAALLDESERICRAAAEADPGCLDGVREARRETGL
ncbi:tetratricopeptide repeat protein [Rubrivirga sp. IMCC43871]|uniref:serine/threonine-protein kinase n=1 Tax=Rubrivirga sp. IMCC43871 TaxID=3391575 RepID=UPI0039903960